VMSENLDLVRKALLDFTAHMDAPQPFLSAAFTWYTAPGWVEASEYRGLHAVRAFFRQWTDSFEDFVLEAKESREVGERVLVRLEVRGNATASGMSIAWDFGVFFADFREKTVGEARAFMSWEDALDSVGLTE
jgi:hypothetical protein